MKKIIRGKVRDVFEVDDAHLAIVTTDRISAFDVILNSEIPGKGVALNSLSNFWFSYTSDIVPNHLVSASLGDFPAEFQQNPEFYRDRTVLVKKLQMLPYEFIVRGYLFGNMWEAYRQGKAFCGRRLSGTYQQAEQLAEPIVTPSRKAAAGHDEYISIEQLQNEIGEELTQKICALSLELYHRCYQHAKTRGILIADTKFEFGFAPSGELTLDDSELRAARALVGRRGLQVSGADLSFARSGMGITLDGIAKGYIADRVSAVLTSAGVKNHLVNAGGDIMASGHKSPGVPWRVAVQSPTGPAYAGELSLSGKAIATSGSYEIYYDASRRHHHLINPASGFSPSVGSVSVVAGTAMEADTLATALSILPPSDALKLVQGLPGRECCILSPDGCIYTSLGWASFA